MHPVQVDEVRPEAAERSFDGRQDVARAIAARVIAAAGRKPRFRRDHQPIARRSRGDEAAFCTPAISRQNTATPR